MYCTVLPCTAQVRILCGLGEGVTAPAMFAMLARWSAPQERSRWQLIRAANGGYRSTQRFVMTEKAPTGVWDGNAKVIMDRQVG